MTRPLAIPVVVVIVLAGCHGLVPWIEDDDQEQTPTTVADGLGGQVTTSPVTASPAADEDGPGTETGPSFLAPGVTDEGVVNSSLLLERHFAILEHQSRNGTYVAVFRSGGTTLAFPFERTFTSTEEYVVQHPERWYRSWTATVRTADETAASEEWVTASDSLSRVDRPDEPVQYGVESRSAAPGHPPALDRELKLLLGTVNPRRGGGVSVEERKRDGTTVYVVSRTSVDTNLGTTITTTRTFHVREDGFVSQYSRESVHEPSDGDTSVSVRHFAFEIRPNGTLEPPDWAGRARESGNDDRADDG